MLTGEEDGGFFVFGDISVKIPGEHRLSFSLFELRKYVIYPVSPSQTDVGKRGSNSEDTGEVIYLKSIISEPFRGIVWSHDFSHRL